MIRLLNFTRTQERREEKRGGFSVGMKKREGLYSSGGENINGIPFNEG